MQMPSWDGTVTVFYKDYHVHILSKKLSTKASAFCIVLLLLEFKRLIILSSYFLSVFNLDIKLSDFPLARTITLKCFSWFQWLPFKLLLVPVREPTC